MAPASSKEFLDIQATVECGFTLKLVRDMIKTYNVNPSVSATRNGRTMILSKCAICGIKKSKFIKNQEAKGLLSSLGLKTPLSKIPLLGDVLF